MRRIAIFGKKDCPKCDAAKKKMDLLKLSFTFYDLQEIQSSADVLPDWRTNGCCAALALYNLGDKPELPVFVIDDEAMTYPDAMKRLKESKDV